MVYAFPNDFYILNYAITFTHLHLAKKQQKKHSEKKKRKIFMSTKHRFRETNCIMAIDHLYCDNFKPNFQLKVLKHHIEFTKPEPV